MASGQAPRDIWDSQGGHVEFGGPVLSSGATGGFWDGTHSSWSSARGWVHGSLCKLQPQLSSAWKVGRDTP